ncbi:MAG: hypothetical protein WC879_09140 [Melioribacteraceae bacterium]
MFKLLWTKVKILSKYFDVVKRNFKDYLLFIILTFLLLVLVALIIYKNRFLLNFTENTGYYFYSSLLQANAAIISIFGVFFIYKVQSLQSLISDIFNSYCQISSSAMDYALKFKAMDLEQKKERLKANNSDNPVSKFYKQWYEAEVNLVKIKEKIIKPSILLSTAIILQSIFLLLSNDIHLQGSGYEFISFLLTILYESYVLILLSKTIYEITV